MTFGSLFAGIGGMDLGLERAGMQCRWQVEINPYCRKVLAKHWPDVPRHDDVKTFPPTDPGEWQVDLIAGGFPCQDVSLAGKGAGLDGERSGLWFEYSRIIRELRPQYVLVENVPGLLVRGIDRVLGSLASLGYDAEWACVPAAAVGAPHIRDRVFLLAYANSERQSQPQGVVAEVGGWTGDRSQAIPHTASIRRDGPCPSHGGIGQQDEFKAGPQPCVPTRRLRGGHVPDDDSQRLEVGICLGRNARQGLTSFGRANRSDGGQWQRDPAELPESGVGRVVARLPKGMDQRIRALGNSVVPQVAEWIGRRLMESV